MRKLYLNYILVFFALIAAAFQSCNKHVDGIDNNVVVETPYTLYYADTAGVLYNTNDGTTIDKILFPADGYASRALCTSGTDILWVKYDLHLSSNNGINFNTANYLMIPSSSGNYFNINDSSYNQTLILNAQDEGRVYITTDPNGNNTFTLGGKLYIRGMGIAYSEQNGNATTWYVDTDYDNALNVTSGSVVQTNINVTTLTELTSNTIIAYDPFHNRVFSKDSKTDPWIEEKQTHADSLPMPNAFTLAHFNNMLVAVDYKYGNGAYYSTNLGQDWTKFNGLPAGRNLYYAASPFNQVLLVGTDSMGVYKLGTDNVTFASSNTGLETSTSVYSMTSKLVVYKNESVSMQYIYLATSQGLYRSQDLGQSWIRMQIGNFVSCY
jgi:hypothetical protein